MTPQGLPYSYRMNPILWQPSEATIKAANLTRFAPGQSYSELHCWSVEQCGEFWSQVWDFAGVVGERGNDAFREGRHFIDAKWFPEAKLNFAENLLGEPSDDIAIIFRNER